MSITASFTGRPRVSLTKQRAVLKHLTLFTSHVTSTALHEIAKKFFYLLFQFYYKKNVMFNYLYYFDIDYCVIICEICLQFFFLPFLCRYYKTDYDKKF